MNKDGRKHRKKKPEDLVPKYIRDEHCREIAPKGAPKPGQRYNVLPLGTVKLLERLKENKFRMQEKHKDNPDACELSGMAQETVIRVMLGKAGRVKAPSRLKAAQTVLDQVQEPVLRESKVIGAIDLGAAVNEALNKIK